jgi:hypothetical protein
MTPSEETIAFDPDHKAIGIRRAKKRVHMEMRSRISRAWPTEVRLELITAQLARLTKVELTSDGHRMVDRDCADFTRMIQEITEIRLAADLLKKGFDQGLLNPHSFDFAADKYWKGTT